MRAAARQAPQTGVPENTRQVAQLISLSQDTKEITKKLGVTLYFRGRGNIYHHGLIPMVKITIVTSGQKYTHITIRLLNRAIHSIV